MPDTLGPRALNRATLARQMLLVRARINPLEAVERLVGLQAQVPRPPFVGLWTRVEGLEVDQVLGLLERRQLVRATMMRGTLHVVSSRDYRKLRPAFQASLTQGMLSILRDRARGLDMERVTAEARKLFAASPRTFEDARAELLERFPGGDERAMGYAARIQVPLVQVPEEGERWGFPAASRFALAEDWLKLKSPLPREAPVLPLVARYLAAFGPATPADMQTWSGIAGLAEHFQALGRKLVTFRDERGRQLFDLPDAPRPPEDAPAPPRFLPDFDNLVLSHADRTRVIADQHRGKVVLKNLQVRATFLVDGFVAGTWKVERKKRDAALVLEPFSKLSRPDVQALSEEGERLLRFCEPDAAGYAVRASGG